MAQILTPISDLDSLLGGWVDNGDGTFDSNELHIDAVAKQFYFKGAGNFVLPGSGVTGQALYSFFKDRWKNVASLTKYDFPMLSITNEQFEFIDSWRPAENPVYQLIDNARTVTQRNAVPSAGSNFIEIDKFEAAEFGSNEAITVDGGSGTFYTITNIDNSGTYAKVYFAPDLVAGDASVLTTAGVDGTVAVDVYFKTSTRKMLRTAGWAESDTAGNVSRRYSGIITLGSMGDTDQPYFTQNNLSNMTVRGPRQQATTTPIAGIDVAVAANIGDTTITLGAGDGASFTVGGFYGLGGQTAVYEVTAISGDDVTFTPGLVAAIGTGAISVIEYSLAYRKFDSVLDANTGMWFWNSYTTGASNGLGIMPDYSFTTIETSGTTNTFTLTDDPNYPTDASMMAGGIVGMTITIKGTANDDGQYKISAYDNATKTVTVTHTDDSAVDFGEVADALAGASVFGLVDTGVSWYPLILNTTYTGPVNEPVQIFGTTQFGDQYANNGSAEADFKMYVRERGKIYSDADLFDIGVQNMTYIVYRFPLSNSNDLKLATTADTDLDVNEDGIADTGAYATINVTNYDATIKGAWASGTDYAVNDVVQGSDGRWYLNAVDGGVASSGDSTSLAATFAAHGTDPSVSVTLEADVKYGDLIADVTSSTGLEAGSYIEIPGHTIRYRIESISVGGGVGGSDRVTFTPGFHLNLAFGATFTVNQYTLSTTGSDLAGNVWVQYHGEREVETGTYSAYTTIVDANTAGQVAGATKEQVYDWAQWGLRQSSTIDTRYVPGEQDIVYTVSTSATAGDTTITLDSVVGLAVDEFIGIQNQGTIYKITDITGSVVTFTPGLAENVAAGAITVDKYSKIEGTINGNISDVLAYFVGDTLHTSQGVFIDDIAAADVNNIVFHDYSDVTHTFPLTVLVNINFNSNLVGDADAVFYAYYKDISITDATITNGTNTISKDIDSGYGVNELVGLQVTISDAINAEDNGTRTITANTSNSITVDGSPFTANGSTETVTIDIIGDEFGTPGALQVTKADLTKVGSEASNNISTAEVNGTYSFNYAYDVDATGGRTTGTEVPIVVVAIGLGTGQYVSAEGTITTSGANISLVAPLERNYSNPA